MPADDQDHRAQDNRHQIGEIAIGAFIGAALMLYFGWGSSWFRPADESLYSRSILAFMWVLRVGGLLMLVAAVALWTGFRLVLAYDAVVAILLGVVMAAIGGLWLVHADWSGILPLIFGVLFARSGWGSWQAFRGTGIAYAVPVRAPLNTSTVPPVETLDPVARQAAMDRLLASKKREEAADPAPGRAKEPEPAPAPAPVVRPAVTKAAHPAKPPPKIPPLPKEEPPPDGFLAQLGRDDS